MKLGIEVLASVPSLAKSWGRCALLCNQASVSQDFQPSWEILRILLGDRLVAFFGPQHGFHSTVQDNMIETYHQASGPFGLPVFSLYSEVREPSPEMLDGIDTIIVDLQIVGCRVYTFKYTIAACLRIAKKLGIKVVILDRPNPLNGEIIEGRVLSKEAKSFVGEFQIPLRHGLSVGEAAKFFNLDINAELDVVDLQAWNPSLYWGEYFRHWVLTSPNLPTLDSVYIYPATVMLEGTNLSEGRGTSLPFQFVGAPYIKDGTAFAKRVLDIYSGEGIYLRPTEFQPCSQKWHGQVCRGFQIHITQVKALKTFQLGLAIIQAALDLAPKEFAWKKPGYEYDFKNMPIDLILGHLAAHTQVEKGFSKNDVYWQEGLSEYKRQAEHLLIYPRKMHFFS